MENTIEQKKDLPWVTSEEAKLPTLPDGSMVLTDTWDVVTKDAGIWWYNNGIIANLAKVKKVLVFTERVETAGDDNNPKID